MNLVPPVAEPEDRCTCGARMFHGRVERVLKETCPEHGRWARRAREIEAAAKVEAKP